MIKFLIIVAITTTTFYLFALGDNKTKHTVEEAELLLANQSCGKFNSAGWFIGIVDDYVPAQRELKYYKNHDRPNRPKKKPIKLPSRKPKPSTKGSLVDDEDNDDDDHCYEGVNNNKKHKHTGNTRMRYGRQPRLGEFPSFARVMFYWHGSKTTPRRIIQCGGTILTNRHVLTAAHCVEPIIDNSVKREPVKAYIQVGTIINEAVDQNDDTFLAKKVCPSARYNRTIKLTEHDLTIIKVDRDFNFDSLNTQPACLPEKPDTTKIPPSYSGELAYLVGMGHEQYLEPSLYLSRIKATRDDCPHDWKEDTLCMSYRDSNTTVCRGDSGGPALAIRNRKQYIVGSMSVINNTCYRPMTDHKSRIFLVDVLKEREEILRLIARCY